MDFQKLKNERLKYKRNVEKKYDLIYTLDSSSPEYKKLWDEIQRDELELKRMGEEATIAWLQEKKDRGEL